MFIVLELARLTADPAVRTTGTGKTVCTFTVACDSGRRDDAGEKIPNFFFVTAWNKEAERVQKYLKKGDPVSVVGQFYARNYKTTEGEQRTALDVDATKITFLPNPKRTQQEPAQDTQATQRRRRQQQPAYPQKDEGYMNTADDDEMPF